MRVVFNFILFFRKCKKREPELRIPKPKYGFSLRRSGSQNALLFCPRTGCIGASVCRIPRDRCKRLGYSPKYSYDTSSVRSEQHFLLTFLMSLNAKNALFGRQKCFVLLQSTASRKYAYFVWIGNLYVSNSVSNSTSNSSSIPWKTHGRIAFQRMRFKFGGLPNKIRACLMNLSL